MIPRSPRFTWVAKDDPNKESSGKIKYLYSHPKVKRYSLGAMPSSMHPSGANGPHPPSTAEMYRTVSQNEY